MSEHIAAEIVDIDSSQWLEENYLPYARYTITDRAITDRDGLKPVNRRLLWSMWVNKHLPDSTFIKAARIVGETMAYHPHGDAAIADALARMGQPFNMRVPLIDVHGTVGKFTGDVPAAARYWEGKLNNAALELMSEFSDDALLLGKNYDGDLDEPEVLPTRWPQLVVNGTEGIAVGYASKIFPHNPSEVMDACIAYTKKKNFTNEDLQKHVLGPDFPTGGELLGIDGVKEYIETGKGKIIVRGRYNISRVRNKDIITFYELPYQVSVRAVMEQISNAQNEKKLMGIASYKDGTDKKNGLNFNIECKTGVPAKTVLDELFALTKLEETYHANNTVLINDRPEQVGLLQLIEQFMVLRTECLKNKTESKVGKLQEKISRLTAIEKVLVDIDKTIKIVRNSDNSRVAAEKLQKTFGLTLPQAEHILRFQIQQLTKTSTIEIKKEREAKQAEHDRLQNILNNPTEFNKELRKELEVTKKVIQDPRRTQIQNVTTEHIEQAAKLRKQQEKAVSKDSPSVLIRLGDGSIVQKLGGTIKEALSNLDGRTLNSKGGVRETIATTTQSNIILVDKKGTGYRVSMSTIPVDQIMPAQTICPPLSQHGLAGISLDSLPDGHVGFHLGTNKGKWKTVRPDYPTTLNEFPVVINLDDDETIVGARWINSADGYIVSISDSNQVLVSDAKNVRPSGAKAGTIAGMNIQNGDKVIGHLWTSDPKNLFILSYTGMSAKLTKGDMIPTKGRNTKGVVLQGSYKNEGKLLDVWTVDLSVAENTLTSTILKTDGKKGDLPVTDRGKTGEKGFEPKNMILS